MIHLDTTFLVDVIREGRQRGDGPARRWLREHRTEAVAISVFVLSELLVGAESHAEPAEQRRRVLRACGDVPIVVPDARLAGTYASTHVHLSRRGTP
ncbi:MAG: type II toxin-antitoxin system VapC family toxin, partial [Propioniciclava sp.]